MLEPKSLALTPHRRLIRWLTLIVFCLTIAAGVLPAQTATPTSQDSTGQQDSNGQKQQAPPEAGGPESDSGPYAIPKVNPDRQQARPAPPPAPKPAEGMPSYSINVDVPLVSVDALVVSKDGQFIPGLQKEHFRILEDNVVQPIQTFGLTKAGFTAVLLVEFASTPAFQVSRRQFLYDALRASYAFTDQMQKNDYVSVISYDMKPSILVDFTSDKQAIYGALNTLRIPGFSETNMFDALYDTLDRLDRIDGRKEIILISSGLDTFSRDELRQSAEEDQSDAQCDNLHHQHRILVAELHGIPRRNGRAMRRWIFCRAIIR